MEFGLPHLRDTIERKIFEHGWEQSKLLIGRFGFEFRSHLGPIFHKKTERNCWYESEQDQILIARKAQHCCRDEKSNAKGTDK